MALEKFSPRVSAQRIQENNWHTLESGQVLDELKTLDNLGLSADEVTLRQEQFGPNQLEEAAPTTFWQLLWAQFNNFVVMLLIIAAVLSALLGDYIEAAAILAIVILNALVGTLQDLRAEQSLAALHKLSAPEAHVIRDGSHQVIPSSHLVPGDLVILETGNYIPADVRLLEAINLRIEEAALTGESIPAQKDASVRLAADIPPGDRKNTAFMGTVVSYGRGKGVVTSTGMNTQIGMIAEMLQSVEQEPTPLQKRLDQLGKSLGWAAIAVCGLVFLVGWLRGSNPLDMFLIAISLAIAAVPEGLPAVVTISLALGMREMIDRNALIRRLSSVETLGSATVICSDKTGTLTQNEMTATRMWVDGEYIQISGSGYAPYGEFMHGDKPVDIKDFPAVLTNLWIAALNNNAELEVSGTSADQKTFRVIGDPTEGALVVAAAKAGANLDQIYSAYPRLQEIPFDSTRKRMVTVHRIEKPHPDDLSPVYTDEQRDLYAVTVKGAPDIVLKHCSHFQGMDDHTAPLDENQRMRILTANDLMSQDALRVLGMAYRITQDQPDIENVTDLERDLVFAGLIGMIDPPRPEVTAALEKGNQAGIRTVMITGDYPKTARAIAESIGLIKPGHHVLTGQSLVELDDESLRREVLLTDVYARVSPEHKLRIVEALRAGGQVVAMTGDGVNDAPSIKRADIGVAMGISGTDVAKESADMVLTDDNYASIVDAVEQGRVIYSNIRKFVYYLLSCNLAEILTIFLGTLFTGASPLTALQLLWLNLITDGAPALALATEKGDPDIMKQKPRPPTEPIINRFMVKGTIIQTIAITLITLSAYLIGLKLYPDEPLIAMTMAFVTLSLSELLRAYTARSERYPILKIGVFNNRYMNLAVISSFTLIMLVVYIPFLQTIFETYPLNWSQWQFILPLLVIPSLAAEATKYILALRTNR